ncbi:deoxynucleotide monophosphate kinase family protein [Bacillus subtilis]
MKLAFTGRIASGKDAATNYVVTMHDFQPFTFSSKGKSLFYDLFPEMQYKHKPRQPMRDFINGITELPVPGAESVWVDYEFRKINDYIKRQCCRPANVLITDIRKPIEYDRVRAEGFKIVRIVAPESLRIERAKKRGDKFDAADLEHATETAVDDFEVDYEITNDGTIDELYAKLDALMADLGVGV